MNTFVTTCVYTTHAPSDVDRVWRSSQASQASSLASSVWRHAEAPEGEMEGEISLMLNVMSNFLASISHTFRLNTRSTGLKHPYTVKAPSCVVSERNWHCWDFMVISWSLRILCNLHGTFTWSTFVSEKESSFAGWPVSCGRVMAVIVLHYKLGFPARHGGTPKWMVDKGKPKHKLDNDWGYPYFRKPPNILWLYCDKL